METLKVNNGHVEDYQKAFKIRNSDQFIDVFEKINKNNVLIELKSDLFDNENYHISLKNNEFKVLLTEVRELNKPAYLHHFHVKNTDHMAYERLRTFALKLPVANFYIEEEEYDEAHHSVLVTLKHYAN